MKLMTKIFWLSNLDALSHHSHLTSKQGDIAFYQQKSMILKLE